MNTSPHDSEAKEKDGEKDDHPLSAVYNISAILELLPHRYPFIMVDRILSITPGESITGLKNVTINEPFFQGHFPKQPIMPGVLILESLAQTGAVLVLSSGYRKNQGNPVYLTGMDRVVFRKPVVPGDQLILKARIIKARGHHIKVEARAFVDETIAAEAMFFAYLGEIL